jgi:acetylornithine/succinyldiaminopimelate/putrescine aminotransferase
LSVQSYWPTHASVTSGDLTPGRDAEHPLDARRCTVQLSTGRLYLDAVASSATALLGHDLPPMLATDELTVAQMLASLAPGYVCFAMTSSFAAACDFAARFSRSTSGAQGRVVEINALDGEPAAGADILVVHENETLGRSGRWLASAAWKRTPDIVVVGEALALGFPFGAVLARGGHAANHDADSATLARVAAAIAAVENEGLLQHGREVADYLMARLLSMRDSCPQIERVEGLGLSVRIALTPPLAATQIRRRMCERGVLAGVDGAGRLAIDPPLPLRIAEADVITGALRGSILSLQMVSASPCCAACEDGGL